VDRVASYLFLGLAVIYAIYWIRYGRWLAFGSFYGALIFAVLELRV
jgi:hypothetical protein